MMLPYNPQLLLVWTNPDPELIEAANRLARVNQFLEAWGEDATYQDEYDEWVQARLADDADPLSVAQDIVQYRQDDAVDEETIGTVTGDPHSEDEPDEGDALLAELEAGPAPDDLEGLLRESIAVVQEAKAAKAARERLKRNGAGASYAEREEDARRIAEWEAKHEWDAVANGALFTRRQCVCGHMSETFDCLMRHEVHKHIRTGQRWRVVRESLAALPNETLVITKQVPMCWHCAPAKGWLLSQATEWKG